MTDAVEVMEPKQTLQELSPEQYAMLLKLLEAFTAGRKVLQILIVVISAIGLVALALQHIFLAGQAYRGYQNNVGL